MSAYTDAHARSHGQRPSIEAWPNQFPESDTEIEITLPEFTCHCPKTGQPDFATLRIVYVPDTLCLELKSLKEYAQSYREMGVFHENVVNLFHQDLSAALKPRRLLVEGRFNARGGISTTVRRGSAGA
ncbi:MAG: NADPH-dependent 7-cyano-7-deazaguanine reductase QueF [Calditrichaeota bacterium]|nr:NADPH-dependent 7-cyano-7-deazaguanine reductase QueF [Candidatus Cloacimonadota bacterium]MCA9785956.1 NADPH-dependent 7-cyano-7-deazaguanine reductase QueF [Candidatus Cloacimonadota bacterium]MCB1045631.1 NADPH-dependent 7-cyano-7-deazaguanine reductase QueF [Calditrichota bacterium]MCB9474613.1 NADPH-dependent 7-cyano-7-deazaguanine reductase QueF [Candidatus Delongbacteria bacterium]